jgi:hypothetical protein
MKNATFALCLVAPLFTAATAYPQQASPAPERSYAMALYFKVHNGKEAAFIERYKTGAGYKVQNALMKSNPDALGWSLRRAVFGGNPAPAAGWVLTVNSRKAPKDLDPATRDDLYRSACGMTYSQYMQEARSLSDLVGSTLSHVHAVTPGWSQSEGDFVVARRLKSPAGKGRISGELIESMRLPLFTARVQEGKSLKGWAYSHLAFSGDNTPYDATETTVYKSLADALEPGGEGAALFQKLFPGKSYTQYMDRLRETSTVVATEAFRVMVAVRAQQQ